MQTERRGGAGPVRGLLGGKDLTGRFTIPEDGLSIRPEESDGFPIRPTSHLRLSMPNSSSASARNAAQLFEVVRRRGLVATAAQRTAQS